MALCTLSKDAGKELVWWQDNIWTSVKHVEVPDIDVQLGSDACNIGWGRVCNGVSTGGHWSSEEANYYHINGKELYAAFLSMKTFCSDLRNIHIHCRIDNTTAVACINNQGN